MRKVRRVVYTLAPLAILFLAVWAMAAPKKWG